MTRAGRALLAALVLACPLAGCYGDVKVVQGTVVAVDEAANTLTLKDERPPFAALVYGGGGKGAGPGDTVRLAFRETDGRRTIVRLQNLSAHQEAGAKK
jgi:hypothetical protein